MAAPHVIYRLSECCALGFVSGLPMRLALGQPSVQGSSLTSPSRALNSQEHAQVQDQAGGSAGGTTEDLRYRQEDLLKAGGSSVDKETTVRLDQAKTRAQGLEFDFGSRWKAGKCGSEGRTQFENRKRRTESYNERGALDLSKLAASLGGMNDLEAMAIFDREDAKTAAAATAAAAARLRTESADEYSHMLREAAMKRMRDSIRANMSTLHATFREVDRDMSGMLSPVEMIALLQRSGVQHTKQQVYDLFRQMGVHGTDREFQTATGDKCRCGGKKTWPCEICLPKVSVSFSMLRSCIVNNTQAEVMMPRQGADELTRIGAWLQSNMKKVVDLFRSWDASGDSLISPKEFRQAMDRLGLKLKADEVAALFARFDWDGSGGISYSEMRRALSARNKDLRLDDGGKVMRTSLPRAYTPLPAIWDMLHLALLAAPWIYPLPPPPPSGAWRQEAFPQAGRPAWPGQGAGGRWCRRRRGNHRGGRRGGRGRGRQRQRRRRRGCGHG